MVSLLQIKYLITSKPSHAKNQRIARSKLSYVISFVYYIDLSRLGGSGVKVLYCGPFGLGSNPI